ncbi:MAG: hypothetical protein BWY10_00065 [Chloroflexi bacterium ADurb.Bin180]|nr:MAG: hypothetical protein BWY10_00065 [Chloroflexi bacterium ADurb.Bin180]
MGLPTPSSSGAPPAPRSLARFAARLAVLLPSLVRSIARHWLALANLLLGLQATLPFLAPYLMHTGHTRSATWLYKIYAPLCHQLPERSFFLFGPQWTYTLPELMQLTGGDVPLRYIGDAALGFKTTVCQRDSATYLAMWLAGLVFIFLRRRLRPLPLKVFALLCLPIAVDGFGQLLALWDSSPFTRITSGALFGLACVWLAFPAIESGMRDLQESPQPDPTP